MQRHLHQEKKSSPPDLMDLLARPMPPPDTFLPETLNSDVMSHFPADISNGNPSEEYESAAEKSRNKTSAVRASEASVNFDNALTSEIG